MDDKQKLIKEYARIIKDTPYALKTYLKTFDNTQKKMVPLELFPDQIQLIQDYDEFNENLSNKYRQAGVTTVTAAWASKKLQLAKKNNPERILIIANKMDIAVEMANKIRGFLDQWPPWINVGYSEEKNSERRFKLKNGSEVKAVATSKDALRGYTPTILIFDEAAHIDAGQEFWSQAMSSLSTGGKVIVISTPNGNDPIYFPIYDGSIRGINNFKITHLKWFKDPRYTKDLKWVKCDDIIHYMLNREKYNDDEICVYDLEINQYDEFISLGYKPYSSWYESMAKKLKYNRRDIAQEIESDFLGSGDNVISSTIRENIKTNMMRPPKDRLMDDTIWVWKEPIEGHRYILGCDVSRGDSEDYSSINIIDFDDMEQVFEYVGKIPPDYLADLVYKWSLIYKPFIVVDITGGMGVATSRKLVELGYKNTYVEGMNTNNFWETNLSMTDKIPGINFNNKRIQIIASFEEHLRKGFIVRSERLYNELTTFIYKNGRPDHTKGSHDDCIMSMAMAMYVGDVSFTQLERNDAMNKAIIESWKINETTHNVGEVLNPVNYINQIDFLTVLNNPASNLQNYNKYSWLFGKGKM